MNLKQVRINKNVKAKALADAIETDEPMISKFENYKCLPIPKQLERICDYLECTIEQIYSDEEIYIKKKKEKAENKKEDCYKITIRLPEEARKRLKTILKRCGYKDITYWIYRCYERLLKQYEYKTKNDPSNVGASKGRVGGI